MIVLKRKKGLGRELDPNKLERIQIGKAKK